MSTEKMREGFEAWLESRLGERSAIVRVDDGYLHLETEVAWQAWQASRAAVMVELPKPFSAAACRISLALRDKNEILRECRAAIKAAGVRVK